MCSVHAPTLKIIINHVLHSRIHTYMHHATRYVYNNMYLGAGTPHCLGGHNHFLPLQLLSFATHRDHSHHNPKQHAYESTMNTHTTTSWYNIIALLRVIHLKLAFSTAIKYYV